MNKRPLLKMFRHGWALTNFGILWGFYRTRREAIQFAEENTGEPWEVCSAYLDVRKATLSEGWKP